MHNDSTKPARIGAYWPGQGGIYAGVARGYNGAPDHYLLVAEPTADTINWPDAKRWAGTLEIEGHSDFALPDRREQELLYVNLPELFSADWYWSSAQCASDGGSAWCQDFNDGDQSTDPKVSKLRARAVRRLVIIE